MGAKRRQALLKYLGGLQGVKKATLDEIASVPGISLNLLKGFLKRLKRLINHFSNINNDCFSS